MMRRSIALLTLLALNAACDGEGRGGIGISGSTLPASQLGFTVQPASAVVATPIAPAIQVAIQNASGTTIPTFAATVTLTLTPGTGTSGAILTGTVAAASINGIAAFNNVRVSQAGTGYTIQATAAGLVLATSSAFNITP
jgi:hypothetical protein